MSTEFDGRLNDWFDSVEPKQIPSSILPTVFTAVAQKGQLRGPRHQLAAMIDVAWTPRVGISPSLAMVLIAVILMMTLAAVGVAAGLIQLPSTLRVIDGLIPIPPTPRVMDGLIPFPPTPRVMDGLIALEDAQDEALRPDQLPHQQIRFIDPQTGQDVFTTPESAPSCGAHFSPDGSQYAFLDQDTSDDIWVAVAPARTDAEPTLLERKTAQVYFDPSWAPDGSAFVMTMEVVAEGATSRELQVVPIDGSPARTITDIQASYAADWSPSGEWIAFVSMGPDHVIHLIRPDGTDLRVLRSSGGDSVAWSPLSDELAYTASDGRLHVVGLDGHELFGWSDGQDPNINGEIPVGDLVPMWSPDATKIALIEDGSLHVFDLAANSDTQVPTPRLATGAAWSADGLSLGVVTATLEPHSGDLWQVYLDGSQPRRIAQHVQSHCMSNGKALSWQEIRQ